MHRCNAFARFQIIRIHRRCIDLKAQCGMSKEFECRYGGALNLRIAWLCRTRAYHTGLRIEYSNRVHLSVHDHGTLYRDGCALRRERLNFFLLHT